MHYLASSGARQRVRPLSHCTQLRPIELILSSCVSVEIIIQMDIIIREAEWRDKAGMCIITAMKMLFV